MYDVDMNNTITPIKMTALAAATKTYQWVASKPENAKKTPAQIRPLAAELLTAMIRKGAFEIVEN